MLFQWPYFDITEVLILGRVKGKVFWFWIQFLALAWFRILQFQLVLLLNLIRGWLQVLLQQRVFGFEWRVAHWQIAWLLWVSKICLAVCWKVFRDNIFFFLFHLLHYFLLDFFINPANAVEFWTIFAAIERIEKLRMLIIPFTTTIQRLRHIRWVFTRFRISIWFILNNLA